jgi:ABC-type nickel/cobalt efflux system permease component RcnA
MLGLDDTIAGLGRDGGIVVALVVALLLGLRHATDPDHLTAVSMLILSDRPGGVRRAAALGLAWGAGHAVTMCALGLPLVVIGAELLPEWIQRAAEVCIGVVIAALAVRLLVRWRRGYFHSHPHRHGELVHAHPHLHEETSREPHPRVHAHGHRERLGRTPAGAFGVGLLHGVGGSAGAGILLVGAISRGSAAALALVLFAGATAISMAAASTLTGSALTRPSVRQRMRSAVPALGVASLVFAVWYALGALESVPYVF